jgi:signal transduction histidine kinase
MYLVLDRTVNYLAPGALLVSQPVVLLLALAAAVPVALRRLRPLLALAVLLGISVVVQAAGNIYANRSLVFLAVAFVLYLVAATCRRKVAAMALGCSLAVLAAEAASTAVREASTGSYAIPLALVTVISWAFGSMMRQRRAYDRGLQQQAASRAVAEERLRIARELHDVVAHSMSVIAVQAGFGAYVIDSQPAKARDALGAIQATSRDALDEMRRMLSVLRQSDQAAPAPGQPSPGPVPGGAGGWFFGLGDLAEQALSPARLGGGASGSGGTGTGSPAARMPNAPLRPAPGLADLDRLITRVAHAGVHVDVRITGDRGDIPAGIDLSAFRIIQEALTNVVKHAAAPNCRVRIEYGEDDLRLEITDDGHGCATPAGVGVAPGGPQRTGEEGTVGGPSGAALGAGISSGHGLIGMRERVHLCGGQFIAGPLPERGFRVAAALPLKQGAA